MQPKSQTKKQLKNSKQKKPESGLLKTTKKP